MVNFSINYNSNRDYVIYLLENTLNKAGYCYFTPTKHKRDEHNFQQIINDYSRFHIIAVYGPNISGNHHLDYGTTAEKHKVDEFSPTARQEAIRVCELIESRGLDIKINTSKI